MSGPTLRCRRSKHTGSCWIFPSRVGAPLEPNRVREAFFLALKHAKLRRIRFHDMRHTFASWLIANGESLVYVKEQLGHHSIQITVDTYGHLIPGANRKAVNALDDPGWNVDAHNVEAIDTMRNSPRTTHCRIALDQYNHV